MWNRTKITFVNPRETRISYKIRNNSQIVPIHLFFTEIEYDFICALQSQIHRINFYQL